MGYESARFVSELNEEFHCSICAMVLENPMQSPCEHIFCNDCIKEWIKVDASCPVDRCALTLDDLKPTPRYFRNILDKMEIRCDFEPKGCQTITQLEHLRDHLTKCVYNLDSEVICDKGCNTKMTRREYQGSNCFIHLATEISKLNDVKNRQAVEITKLYHNVGRQGEEISKLNHNVGRQGEEITKLNSELNRLCLQLKSSENVVSRQQEELQNLNSLNKSPKSHWEMHHMKISLGQTHILEHDDKFQYAEARLVYPLEASNSCFKIQVLKAGGCTRFGLTRNALFTQNYFTYSSNGALSLDGKTQIRGQKWKIGDIIECGIKFPNNFVNDGTASVNVYFSINEQLVFENALEMPQDGFFPFIIIDHGGKVKYWFN